MHPSLETCNAAGGGGRLPALGDWGWGGGCYTGCVSGWVAVAQGRQHTGGGERRGMENKVCVRGGEGGGEGGLGALPWAARKAEKVEGRGDSQGRGQTAPRTERGAGGTKERAWHKGRHSSRSQDGHRPDSCDGTLGPHDASPRHVHVTNNTGIVVGDMNMLGGGAVWCQGALTHLCCVCNRPRPSSPLLHPCQNTAAQL
jgi:hypothetical protein